MKMRFEEKLNLGITEEEVANAAGPADVQPNHKAIFDAIQKLLAMDLDDVYDFATSGGYIEEGVLVINKLKGPITEQVVTKTVHTGNYARIVEISIDKADPVYKVYAIVKLSVSDDRVNADLQRNMARWKDGDPLPFVAYKTVGQALRFLGEIEDKEAEKADEPVKPSAKVSPAADINEAAIQMAKRMNKPQVVRVVQKMTPQEILQAARQGKEEADLNYWDIGKYIFLSLLALSSLVTGLAGIAALIIGFYAVRFIDKHMVSKPGPTQK